MTQCTEGERVGNDIVNEDGEVIGVVGWTEFEVQTTEDATRLLQVMLREDAKVEAKRLEHEAIVRNSEREMRFVGSRGKWFRDHFDAQLQMFAARELEGTGRRTWRCPYGEIALRKQKARWTMVDAMKKTAADVLKRVGLGSKVRVKEVEDVTLEIIEDVIKERGITPEALYADDADEVLRGLREIVEYVPERETVTIKTGVGK